MNFVIHSDICPFFLKIVYIHNNSIDVNISEQMCTATESPLGTCLTDIALALESEECVKA